MAKAKTVRLQAAPEVLSLLATAIATYADAAYPPGGTECSQVARETLMDSARSIKAQAQNGVVEIRTRQRRMIAAATEWFSDEQLDRDDIRRTALKALF
ncbi:MAG: hypothetical protein ACWA5Q_12215 [bacterium]